ncbi:hypothetical protein ACJMK2_020308 [Sinanodonta woodiana]|uniref:Thioredoxin domain-containing protein 9 n=1 Tax=Sinanodonta woodiana TaxID=1069815 RepID=A0ABD3U016_SINWO
MAALSTTAQAQEILDDEALAEEKLLEELETSEIPSYIREARLAELKHKAVEFQELQKQGHGVYNDIMDEKSFLEVTTSEDRCIVHFYHTDYRRCSIMDTHLEKLTEKYYETKFAKMNVEKAKFLVERLKIRVLPAVFCFLKGIVKDRVIGFEELGGTDSFQTIVLEKRLAQSGVIEMAEEELEKKTIFGHKKIQQEDEDSSDDDDGY